MANRTRVRHEIASRQCRGTPYPLPSYEKTNGIHKNCSKICKKDWEDATCSVCMEYPHNAVLLLCSSHEKGCRPYMCGTSFRHSNCLDQYKKAYTKVTVPHHEPLNTQPIGPFSKAQELACPLCRGQVKGWAVVESAREDLNAKKRNCMQDNCSFFGTYKELRKHVRAEHPYAKSWEVDPTLEQKWTRLERERERDDVMGTIRSSMPGAVFFGDYVIEGNQYETDSDEEEAGFDGDSMERNDGMEVVDRNLMPMFLFLQAFGSGGNVGPYRVPSLDRGAMRTRRESISVDFDETDDEDGGNSGTSLAERLSLQGRVVVGHSRRRRRRGRREANGSGDSS